MAVIISMILNPGHSTAACWNPYSLSQHASLPLLSRKGLTELLVPWSYDEYSLSLMPLHSPEFLVRVFEWFWYKAYLHADYASPNGVKTSGKSVLSGADMSILRIF